MDGASARALVFHRCSLGSILEPDVTGPGSAGLNAQNGSLKTLYGGQFTLSTQLIIPDYPAIPVSTFTHFNFLTVPCSKMLNPGRRRAEAIRACLTLAGFTLFPRCLTALKTKKTKRHL